ncbi:MAG: molybdopterin-dependent oxidoreductase [Spirochaetaceae bacterium]|nr:molybdopterin-dependent oxidoreductase [Spirochaetaceae bacterium]
MEKSRFVDDIIIDNALTGILLRSPAASGMLKEIWTPPLPYNVSLVTFADIPGAGVCSSDGADNKKGSPFEIPVFPEKELSWYGQPIALLLGPDPDKLRELAEQCIILADEQPPAEKKIIIERNYSAGDTGMAFEKAERIIEGTYTTEVQDPWPSDPPGVIALPGPENTMTILTSTQWPGHVCASVARCLDIKPAMVKVEPCRLEIHLDGKVWMPSLLACQAAVGARAREKPVKLVLKREEDFLFSSKSVRAAIYIQSALSAHGQILGSRLKITAEFGAFGLFTEEILDRIALGALGAYDHGTIELQTMGLSSPIPPAGPITGFGLTQGFFAAERHASRIADALGEDPAQWRKRFFLNKGKKLAIGTEIRNPLKKELIDTVVSLSDYRRKWAAYELLRKSRRENPLQGRSLNDALRGIGIALAWQGSSFLYDCLPGPKSQKEGVELTLGKDGVLEIRTNFPWGNNQEQCWQLLVNQILGVEQIRIVSLSEREEPSKPIPESGPACLSRSTGVITHLIEMACNTIRKQRFCDPLPITVNRHYHASLAPAWGRPDQKYDENALAPLGWGAAVVEAEIDPAEYVPRIRGIWMALDGGTILTKDRARKSIANAAVHALSWAMHEKALYQNGRIDSNTVKDYPVPGIEDAPFINVHFLESGEKPKGIGELPFAVVPAAYVQALSQALDYPFQSYPVNTQELWAAVQITAAAKDKEL